jgi:hypothetical protein
MLLFAICAHFCVVVEVQESPKAPRAAIHVLADAKVAVPCSELSDRRDWLHAEIDRLHAETTTVEAELRALCVERPRQASVTVPPVLAALPSQSTGAVVDKANRAQPIAQADGETNEVVHVGLKLGTMPARRQGEEEPEKYTEHCYRANSAFTDPSCNCFGQPRPQATVSQAVVTVVVGGWLSASVDAWLLKLLIEEQLGTPTELIPDAALFAAFNTSGVWRALKSGYAMMYPEVAHGSGRRLSRGERSPGMLVLR